MTLQSVFSKEKTKSIKEIMPNEMIVGPWKQKFRGLKNVSQVKDT